MSYKGRYVRIIKNGNYNNVNYKIGEVWKIIDDHSVIVRVEKDGFEVEVVLKSKGGYDIECELLPIDYIPDLPENYNSNNTSSVNLKLW